MDQPDVFFCVQAEISRERRQDRVAVTSEWSSQYFRGVSRVKMRRDVHEVKRSDGRTRDLCLIPVIHIVATSLHYDGMFLQESVGAVELKESLDVTRVFLRVPCRRPVEGRPLRECKSTAPNLTRPAATAAFIAAYVYSSVLEVSCGPRKFYVSPRSTSWYRVRVV